MSKSVKPKKIMEGEESSHYVSARKQRQPKKGTGQPPLTPMIDVTFQLLIFFILTTTFRAAEGQIPGSLPGLGISQQEVELTPQLTIVISHQDGIDKKPRFECREVSEVFLTADELYTFFEKRKGAMENWNDINVVLDPGVTTQWEFAVEAWNQAVRAGYEKIAFKPL